MPAFAGLQTLLTGLAYAYAGVSLLRDPASFVAQVAPLTSLIEALTELKPYKGDEAGLAFVGLLLILLGYYFVFAVYTLDEKFKRNSVSGRILAALVSAYLCFQTPFGSSLVALFGLFNLVTGLAMGLSVGWGDGNAVDIEMRARWEQRRAADAKQGK
ncbi:hypothetical protein JCM8097_007774 [Rhodosporidiobolus ruineniae]